MPDEETRMIETKKKQASKRAKKDGEITKHRTHRTMISLWAVQDHEKAPVYSVYYTLYTLVHYIYFGNSEDTSEQYREREENNSKIILNVKPLSS